MEESSSFISTSRNLVPLSKEVRRARQPLAPADRVGVLQDRPHTDVGKVRVPRVAKYPVVTLSAWTEKRI